MSDALSNLIRSGMSRRQATAVLDSAASASAPEYVHDAETGQWTVTPGQNPGAARFSSVSSYSTDTPAVSGGLKTSLIPFESVLDNSDVATAVDSTHWRFAAAGLYLISVQATLYPITPVSGVEEFLQVTVYPEGLTNQWTDVNEYVMNDYGSMYYSGSAAALASDDVSFDGRIELVSKTHTWQGQAVVTIVRLD